MEDAGKNLLIDEDTKMPLARNSEIVLQELQDETLVYDLKTHKACSLNKTVRYVWKKCDGRSTISSVLRDLEKELKTDLDINFAHFALKELEKHNLLENQLNEAEFPKFSRRKLIGRYAVSALSLPIILSLVAPASAQMASCLATGQAGCNLTPCCPNNTCQAIVGPGGIITNECVATP